VAIGSSYNLLDPCFSTSQPADTIASLQCWPGCVSDAYLPTMGAVFTQRVDGRGLPMPVCESLPAAELIPPVLYLPGAACPADNTKTSQRISVESTNTLGAPCHSCGAQSRRFCLDCDREFCESHIYGCSNCDAKLCGVCLEAHYQEGHWNDSDTTHERYNGLAVDT